VLSAIDANGAGSGNAAFAFLGTGAFTGAGAEIRFEAANGKTVISADLDGNQVADFQIELLGVYSLHASDFLL
jgi:hypothetical protein